MRDTKKIQNLPFCLVLLLVLSGLSVFGQTQTALQPDSLKKTNDSTENFSLTEVIITAQYEPGPSEKSIHKVNIIDRKKIEAMGAQNLRDVLSNELNIRISQDNILGSGITLQGISGQNVKILIDGVAVTGRLNGNIDLSQINMHNVERIEIIEGPLSVNYGTDALAGTINIITKKKQSKIWHSSVTTYYESTGQYNLTISTGFRFKKNSFKLSGGRNYFDGWRAIDKPFHIEKERIADTLRLMQWKPKEQLFGTAVLNHEFKNYTLTLTEDYFYEQIQNRGMPRLPYYETAFDDYYTTNRNNAAIALNKKNSKPWHTSHIVAYNFYSRIKNTYYNDLTTLNQTLTENNGDQDTTRFHTFMVRGSISRTKDSALFNFETGYDLNHERGLGLRLKDGMQTIGDYALFFSTQYTPIHGFTIKPGVRFIYNTAYKAPVVTSVNIKYTIGQHTLRASYARGFRAPSLKELYFYFVDINHTITGNQNLKAEQSHNYMLSHVWMREKEESGLKIETSVFFNTIQNMIALAQGNGTSYSYFNIESYQTTGVQSTATIKLHAFIFSVGGAYVGRLNQIDPAYSEEFLFSPEGKCNLQYHFKKQQLRISLFYKYTGQLPMYVTNENGAFKLSSVQAYSMADGSVSKSLLKGLIQLTFGSKNLFNVKDITGSTTGDAHSGGNNGVVIGMGRTYFIQLTILLASKK